MRQNTWRSILVCFFAHLAGVCIMLPVFLWCQTQQSQEITLAADGHATVAPENSMKQSATPGEPKASPQDSFTLGADDVLAVNVWKEAEVSRTLTVRPDGKISLPLVGELQASGKTPKQLQDEIVTKLSTYIPDPEVTVIVQEIHSHRFNILGRVEHPGSYLLTNSTTVLDAIAMAGGFRDFAKQKSIYVLRSNPDGTKMRLPFNYKEVVKGSNEGQNVRLEPRDTVIVP